ncbi:MAG: DUF445 domain-containing protein [Granulosicoccus sp.]
MLSKNTIPNLVALAIIAASFLLPEPLRAIVLSTGLFALSGALTNWLAVHMLFERIPGLYGSGVVTLHFEEFKTGILRMVHEEILAKDNIERLMKSGTVSEPDTNNEKAGAQPMADAIDIQPLLQGIDLDAAYDQLVLTIVESSFGSMLSMLGGESALEPLRDPFKNKMQQFLEDAANSPRIRQIVSEQVGKMTSSDSFVEKLDKLLRARLDEMTPEMVKDIMQRMIRSHLGWLVVWGGVFGGLIGLLAGTLRLL